MPTSTNANLGGVQNLGDGGSSGSRLGTASTDLVACYGKTPVAQASAIVAVSGSFFLTTTVNAILTAIRNFGIIA
jgi:hypothetical protein